jgi:3-oxoacyl-[acyl-carrier-protein] synthase I
MADPIPLAVISAGVVCSVGLSAASACAAIRASQDNFKETHFIDEIGEPLIGAAVPPMLLGAPEETDGSLLGGEQKLARMFVKAAVECARAAGGIDPRHTALLVLGPETSRPGFSEDKLHRCFTACEDALGRRFHPSSCITQIGSPGLAVALEYAREQIGSGAVRAALIAGIDSFLNTDDINDALASERLLSSENSDGFIPGEAAACVLVTRADAVEPTTAPAKDGTRAPRPPLLMVAGIGRAREPDSWLSGNVSLGRGLAHALRHALAEAKISADEIHHRLADCSGESFFLDEAAYAWGRLLRAPSPPGHDQRLIASSVGESGAAAGPLMLALALDAARKGWAQGPNSLIHLSNSHDQRAALVVVAS